MRSRPLVLGMALANWSDSRLGRSVEKYFTFDHRRLWCMKMAGCRHVRARIVMQGDMFNQFVRKAGLAGTRPEDLQRGRF